MRARLGATNAGMLQLQQAETAMTDTPEHRAKDGWIDYVPKSAPASSERIIAELEARIVELENRWDGLAAKIALAMQQQRDQTGLSYAAFAYAEAAMRSVLATPTSSR